MDTMITSRANPLIIEASKLSDKKYRDANRLFFFEGWKLFDEALKAGIRPERIFITEQAKRQYACLLSDPSLPLITVSDGVYAKISTENAPQGIFCIAKYLDNLIFPHIIYKSSSQSSVTIKDENAERILVCEALQDPGNLGTVIRTANAFGFDRIVLSRDTADVYHPKTVRASMGALFRMKTDITEDLPGYIASLRDAGYDVRGAALHADSVPLNRMTVSAQTVFVVGNEGHGLSKKTIAACNGTVIIPMTPGAESLNASVAASVLMWKCAECFL